MIFKINNEYVESFLGKLQLLIGMSVKHIYASQCSLDIDTHQTFLSDVVLECSSGDGFSSRLKLEPSFVFNRMLGDEINNLKLSFFEGPGLDNLDFLIPVRIYQREPFQIASIKIYGQNRLRKWNEDIYEQYFKEKYTNQDISDQLFTTEFLVFENSEKNQIVFSVNREMIHFMKTQNFEDIFTEDFYFKEELGIEENLEDLVGGSNLKTTERRIKLHYCIK